MKSPGTSSDNWMEGYVKGGFSGTHKTSGSQRVYGKLTGVGERTYSAPPPLVGGDASSFDIEDLYIGWRSGDSSGLGENALDFVVGRTQYKLGHGMLIYDGGSEGGSRGGYWTGARKAFEFAAIGRFKAGHTTIEAFYLDRDELPESDSDSKPPMARTTSIRGARTTRSAPPGRRGRPMSLRRERDGMDVINLRAYLTPFPSLKALSFELEYAKEDNGDLLDSTAWNALAAWQLDTAWKPKISYRYAVFEGDDPNTDANEAFDGLLTGFYDWGAWWQGEIAGEYFASNSNLISSQLRVHAKPSEAISTGLIFYDFTLENIGIGGSRPRTTWPPSSTGTWTGR